MEYKLKFNKNDGTQLDGQNQSPIALEMRSQVRLLEKRFVVESITCSGSGIFVRTFHFDSLKIFRVGRLFKVLLFLSLIYRGLAGEANHILGYLTTG